MSETVRELERVEPPREDLKWPPTAESLLAYISEKLDREITDRPFSDRTFSDWRFSISPDIERGKIRFFASLANYPEYSFELCLKIKKLKLRIWTDPD
jgi:hypothetical protein